ncbi:MAG: ribonuclease Y [Candidatus Omnitrophica bacterium]|nr:ribonuclease Y [Candidatus Omnitrophota bacterium]MCM8808790.1 ribonuclease Y [Candidatus Omnitrophota bacterium]MCM8810060.1 ribonuclease Y [Candidatus Omnitrophota bacterium]
MINSINTLKLVMPWFILWGAISILVGYLWRKYIAERTIKSAEKRAKEIIQEAEDIALKKKREIDIEAKELIYKLRSDFEKETKNKRKELQFQEKRLQQKELAIERKAEIIEFKEEELSKKEKELQKKEEEIKNKEIEYAQLIEEEKRKLEIISGISREEAKNQLLKIMEEEARKEAIKLQQKIENEVRENAEKKAREILLTTMQRLAPEEATESVISVVSLPSDEIKGRIIGREGRNIKVFEALTGVDLIVDDTPEAVTISCFNLYRRELARQALEKLIADGRIHPARIEEIVEKTKKQLEEQLVEDGNRILFEIGIENVHPELVKLLGKLKYRTSFGQNLLIHSKECAFMAGIIASELGYNPKIAKRAALFHDIGKAMDQEVEGAHPDIGGDILKKYGESEEVVNAALYHHNDISINTPYTLITQIADALSATRTGARRDTLEKYLRRIEELEKIASSFKGVDSAYAISAGREVRVIVKPEEITDDDARVLAKEIAKKIEENMEYIGQVKVTVIREKREVEFAK